MYCVDSPHLKESVYPVCEELQKEESEVFTYRC